MERVLEATNSSQVLPVGQCRGKPLLKSRPLNIILPDLENQSIPAGCLADELKAATPGPENFERDKREKFCQ